MKRSVIKKSFAVAITIGVLLTLLGLLRRYSKPMPSFQFLSSRGPAICIKEAASKTLDRKTQFVYSFEADFNDVCADANAELSALGYVDTTRPRQEPRSREYMFRNKVHGGSVTVSILDRHKLSVYSTPRRSEYSSPDLYAYHYRVGWVSVVIVQSRRPSVFWQNLLYWPNRLLRGTRNNPRP